MRRRREALGAPRARARAGRAPRRCGSSAARQRVELERRAQRAVDARERLGVDADGRGEHGHVAGERLEHGQPEALALGGHEHGVGGVHPQRHALGGSTPPSASSSTPAARGERARAVVALLGARRVGGEQQ